jgi:hypothetical protein
MPPGISLATELNLSREMQSQETLQPDETQTHVISERTKSRDKYKSSLSRSFSHHNYAMKEFVPEVHIENNSIVDSQNDLSNK